MIYYFCSKLNNLNNFLFSGIDGFIETFGLPDWVTDAVIDSFHTLPFLFLIFMFIEFFEYYNAGKINHFMKNSGGAFVGSLAAIIPQCGFSIVASSLYTNKLITRGTLIAIYLATSDEALPVLLSNPDKLYLVLPIVFAKLVIAIFAGYTIDFIFKPHAEYKSYEITYEEGCCKHDIMSGNKTNLWLHPLIHTVNVFAFILLITLILNFFITDTLISSFLSSTDLKFKILEPVVTALIGLIPNCAVSIAITMMLIKGTLSFGAAIAGLCSNAGLGLLVLLRKNDNIKDSLFIISLLFVISVISGIIFQFVNI